MYIAFGRSAPYATWLAPLVAVAAAVCCYPFVRWVGWLGDEGIWLDGADRLLRGDRLYTDFFELHPPLGFWLVEAWFRLFGPSILTARLLILATVALIAAFTYLSCLEVSDDISVSFGFSVAWVIWSQQEWPLQVSHHLFTTLFSVISGWAALRHLRCPSTILVWVAGVSAGCAAMITQTRGTLAALATFTAVANKRRPMATLAHYVAGCAVTPLVVLSYIVKTGRSADAFRDIILFPMLHYSNIQWVPFGAGGTYPLRYFYQILAGLLALFAVLYARRVMADQVMWTVLALATAGLLGAFPRPDQVHIGFSLPMAIPLAAYCVGALIRHLPRILRGIINGVVVLATLLILPSARGYRWPAAKALTAPLTDTPRGQVAVSTDESELIKTLSRHFEQSMFFYPYIPLLPFLMNVRQVSKQDVFVPYYTADYQYVEACRAVIEHASLIVIDMLWAEEGFLRRTFPAMPSEPDPNKTRFEAALYSAFQPVWQNKRFAILNRNLVVPASICDKI